MQYSGIGKRLRDELEMAAGENDTPYNKTSEATVDDGTSIQKNGK